MQATITRYLDRRGAAEFLGVSVSRLDFWNRNDLLPKPVRLGGVEGRLLRWRPEELRAWLDHGAPLRTEWEALKASGAVSF